MKNFNRGFSIVESLIALLALSGLMWGVSQYFLQSAKSQRYIALKNDLESLRQNLGNAIDCPRTLGVNLANCGGPAAYIPVYMQNDANNAPTYGASANGVPVLAPGTTVNTSGAAGNWYLRATCTATSLNIAYARKDAAGNFVTDVLRGPIYGTAGGPWPSLFTNSPVCGGSFGTGATTATAAGSMTFNNVSANWFGSGGLYVTCANCSQPLGGTTITAIGNYQIVSLQAVLSAIGTLHNTGVQMIVTDAATGGEIYNGVVNQLGGAYVSQTVSSTVYSETGINTNPGSTYNYNFYFNSSDGGSTPCPAAGPAICGGAVAPASQLNSAATFIIRDYTTH